MATDNFLDPEADERALCAAEASVDMADSKVRIKKMCDKPGINI